MRKKENIYFVKYGLGFTLLPEPDQRQTLQYSTALEIRLLFEDFVGLLESLLVVSIIKPVVDRTQPSLGHRVLSGVLGHLDYKEDEDVAEDESQHKMV